MHAAPDSLTRWPVLEVVVRRARLPNALDISPGLLAEILIGGKGTAARAAPPACGGATHRYATETQPSGPIHAIPRPSESSAAMVPGQSPHDLN